MNNNPINPKLSVLDKKITNLVSISPKDTSIFARVTSNISTLNKYVNVDDIENFFLKNIGELDLNFNIKIALLVIWIGKHNSYNFLQK